MRELALFAGAGGGILGGQILGWRTVCAVELASYPRSVLLARQRDGMLPRFPIWDDVCSFDGKPWRGHVDVISGGFPCQDISSAGKGAGITGEKSGLWSEMARIVGEVRPRHVVVENSPMLTIRGLGVVLGDLAAMGFDARWGVLGAHNAGAPHKRDRIWIVAGDPDRDRESTSAIDDETPGVPRMAANANCERGRPESFGERRRGDTPKPGHDGEAQHVADAPRPQRQGDRLPVGASAQHAIARSSSWWESESGVGRVADGVAYRMDRLRATGNGQVPAVAALAWETLR